MPRVAPVILSLQLCILELCLSKDKGPRLDKTARTRARGAEREEGERRTARSCPSGRTILRGTTFLVIYYAVYDDAGAVTA